MTGIFKIIQKSSSTQIHEKEYHGPSPIDWMGLQEMFKNEL